MASDIHYQTFETYYKKASEAEKENRLQDAKRLYLLAADSLLKAAKNADGEMKISLISRADKLTQISDAITLQPKEGSKGQGRSEKISAASEESGTIWHSSGKPDVRFDDIAGLYDVKESIRRRIILPRQHPEVYQTFRREVNGGILLYGPPGTGKTMIAKAIAAEVDAEFYSIRCSDIVGKYFGEAEKNVKSLFETARRSESAVLFFDEFEALATKRGGDSTVMNRLVPELLSQMDGFSVENQDNILILAATNRPWDLDSAFLRPPRLTEKIYIGLPDRDARLFLLCRAFQHVPLEEGVELESVADRTDGYNAADIIALCGAVKDRAIERTIREQDTSRICSEDFSAALEQYHSSVRKEDIQKIRKWETSMGK